MPDAAPTGRDAASTEAVDIAPHAAPRHGARPRHLVIAIALAVLALVAASFAWFHSRHASSWAGAEALALPLRVEAPADEAWLRLGGMDLVAALLLAGAGVAFVQTPSAMGVTRSEAGRHGSALGLFNLVRFAGSALGAAWVAVALGAGQPFGMLFAVSGCVAVLGVAGTFAGTVVDAGPPTERGGVLPG